jgi:adenylate cyclase
LLNQAYQTTANDQGPMIEERADLPDHGTRRLVAIMFTDMVGYTALAQSDEEQSLRVLERHNRLLRPIFPKYQGREIKTMGDSFLVEFDSALDATKCAIEIQQYLHDYNFSSRDEWRITLRIGIHLGDVIHKGNDVFGDAVNIASRIEPLADPEGICISEQIFDQVRNKLDYPLTKVENVNLRNVKIPLAVYKVTLSWEKSRTEERITVIPTPGPATADRTRIAVLPFANMSSDPENAYFADGITEELIATMSKISGLRVIARTSVMRYKRQEEKSIDQIASELQAGSIMEGSVRKAGDRLRITVQLIDSSTSDHMWSESYDRELKDVFAIQSDISNRVAEALQVQLRVGERRDMERESTANTKAHTLYLKGRYFWNERTKDAISRAVKNFEEAIKLDPTYALVYAGLADCYVIFSDYIWMKPKEAMTKAKEYALKALKIDPRLAEAHACLGLVYSSYEWRWDQAEKEFLQAIELRPSYATAYHWYSHLLRSTGRPKEAYDQIKRANELDPLSRVIAVNLGETLLLVDRLAEGVEQMERLVQEYPDYTFAHAYLGFAYYLDSRRDEAINELRKAVELSGHDPLYEAFFAILLGLVGRRDEANQIIEKLKKISNTLHVDRGYLAAALFGVGRTDEAFDDQLERAYEDRSDSFMYIKAFPWFREFRNDPRWVSFEKRIWNHRD